MCIGLKKKGIDIHAASEQHKTEDAETVNEKENAPSFIKPSSIKHSDNQSEVLSNAESQELQQLTHSSKKRLSCREAIIDYIGDSKVRIHDLKDHIPFSIEEISKTVSLMVAAEELIVDTIFIRKA